MEDRDWMYTGRAGLKEMSFEWIAKSEQFLNVAFANGQEKNFCPCSVCQNDRKLTRVDMGKHLQKNGFVPNYKRWIYHGEFDRTREDVMRQRTDDDGTRIGDMLDDYDDAREPPTEEEPDESAKAYYDMLASAQKPLHEHTKVCQLDAIAQLMALKTEFSLSRDGFDKMVTVIGGFLPEGHLMPKSWYHSKKILRELKMPYEQIHACPKGCVLFRKEYAEENCCPKCKSSRYVGVGTSEDKPKKRIPANVLRYLPLVPRIQRLYMSEETAKQMTWHKHGIRYKKDDHGVEMMVHPSDGEAWKDFDLKNPLKAAEARNVRISIATDGFNPFGMTANSYSCWPMFVMPLNLPPGIIMQRKYTFLPLIIPGPNYPGKNMSVYMQPLIDELKDAWVNGVWTWDRGTRTNFKMHVWYLFSLHDLPAYGLFIGWCVHGKFPCPRCKAAMRFLHLQTGGKYVSFDLHRQFLDPNHPFRQDKVKFTKNTTIEHSAPPELTGLQIRNQLDALQPDLERPGYYLGYGEQHSWTHKPCLWDLPYFDQLLLPHNIDVMHTERNVGEIFFSTMFDIHGRTKDNIKARVDQELLCDRPKLKMQPPKSGKNWRKPKAFFVLTREQRREILLWFKTLMFPDGYAANLKRGVNLDTLRINGMKSHDWHIWLERILPVMIRGYIPEEDWQVLAELSYFFRVLCAKELSVKVVEDMEKLVPVLLCKLEMIFPPGLFVPMMHLILHLPSEARLNGPVYPRWCYGPERMMKDLRQKCTNKARVEASIAEAFLCEEVTNFTTSYYSDNIPTMHNPVSRYNIGDPERESKLSLFKGQLGPAGASGSKKLSKQEWQTITLYIFLNLIEMRPYIDQFVKQFWKHVDTPTFSQEYQLLVDKDFSSWIHQKATNDPSMRDDLRQVAHGFDFKVGTFEKYDINGYRFRTTKHERNRPDRKTTNSGVFTLCGGVEYYGKVEEIYELHFFGSNPPRVVIFKCHWFDPDKTRREDKIGLVEIQRDSKLDCEDVYIVAQQATQVYYLSYPCTSKKIKNLQDWDVVYKVSPRGRAPAPNEEDYRPHIDLDMNDDQLFQEEHGLTGRFEIELPEVEDMEVDNDSDEDDVEEEDVVDEEDLSILQNLSLAGGTNNDGPLQDDIFHDDMCDSDDEYAPVDFMECRSWEEIAVPGKECRPAAGILGRLLKENFPGMVKLPGANHEGPPFTWHHYKAKLHGDGRSFAQRVKDEFWQYYKCADGYEQVAEYVMEKACRKLVLDMHYEVRIQSVINYHFEKNKVKLVKKDARGKTLTKEEYMQVPPRWVVNEGVCWEKMVDKWCTDEWKAKHEQRQLQRAAMIRIPHHQGSRNLKSYGNSVSQRLGQPVSEYEAYALSHKAKASVVTPYNDSDPAEAYTSLTSYANMQQYKEVFEELRGPDSDPTIQPLDPEVVMVAGKGKKHGRFAMGGSLLSTASVPTLPQIKARQTRSSPAIRSRPTPIQLEIQAHVAEERRLGEQRLQEALAENKRQLEAGYYNFFKEYCASNGLPIPPAPTPQTSHQHTPEGGASNDHRTSGASDNDPPSGSSPQF